MTENLYKFINSHSLIRYAVIIKSHCHMTRMMKSTIPSIPLAICEGHVQEHETLVSQIVNMLP